MKTRKHNSRKCLFSRSIGSCLLSLSDSPSAFSPLFSLSLPASAPRGLIRLFHHVGALEVSRCGSPRLSLRCSCFCLRSHRRRSLLLRPRRRLRPRRQFRFRAPPASRATAPASTGGSPSSTREGTITVTSTAEREEKLRGRGWRRQQRAPWRGRCCSSMLLPPSRGACSGTTSPLSRLAKKEKKNETKTHILSRSRTPRASSRWLPPAAAEGASSSPTPRLASRATRRREEATRACPCRSSASLSTSCACLWRVAGWRR